LRRRRTASTARHAHRTAGMDQQDVFHRLLKMGGNVA
jgi:hypothetical protein